MNLLPYIAVIHLGAATAGAPLGGTPVLLYVFGAFVAGGGITALVGLIRYWRRGQVEDTEMQARITKDTIAGAKDILEEYRMEVALVKRQVDDYRQQLNSLTLALAEANVKISHLERDLATAQGEHSTLSEQLANAVQDRQRLLSEIERLREQINRLLSAAEGSEDGIEEGRVHDSET